ncbi:MAG: MoaD/ThiS family protein [Firmicutes bacterium]|nr:MoaD/ThiS family protein [Bacillota bacterium]
MITVHLPAGLADEFRADPVLTMTARTCAEMLQSLDSRYPGIASWLAEPDGRFRQHLSVFVSGRRLASQAATSTPVDDGSEVWVLRAISGG